MKKSYIKYMVVVGVCAIALLTIYLIDGVSGLFINALVLLGAKFITLKRLRALLDWIDGIFGETPPPTTTTP